MGRGAAGRGAASGSRNADRDSRPVSADAIRPDGVELWLGWRRTVVTLMLLFHLTAIIAAPWSSPPPASDLSRAVAELFSPYLEFAYLNHGYRFFAPNPGPSHLVRYKVELADGTHEEHRFPDTSQHWPRLLYHRYFMISESVYNLTEPVREAPPEGAISPQEKMAFEKDRARADALVRSLSRYLLEHHNGQRIELYLQQHIIPPPWEIVAGKQLNDPAYYEERPLGVFQRDEL